MRYRGRPASDNVENLLRKKHDKRTGDDDFNQFMTTVMGDKDRYLSQAEYDRLRAKFTKDRASSVPSKQRRYKNIDAKDHKTEKAPERDPPLPRKRPSQVYVEAPKPKKKPVTIRGPVNLK